MALYHKWILMILWITTE